MKKPLNNSALMALDNAIIKLRRESKKIAKAVEYGNKNLVGITLPHLDQALAEKCEAIQQLINLYAK